jgi:cysteine desulfurase
MTMGEPERLYFDHAATTPLDPRVLEAMLPFLESHFGNPSSPHAEGRTARSAVEAARAEVAELLGASPEEILFISSGTEADNLALLGTDTAHGHVIASAMEHPAVLECLRALGETGRSVTHLKPRPDGVLDPEELAAAMRPETRLVSVMAANNVVGTLQPIRELAAVAREGGALFHTDAVQAAGHIPLDVEKLGVDLLSLSAHKFHGPKGAGALYVRRGTPLRPLLRGGGQEHGLRPSTENVAALAGLGRAARLAREGMAEEAVRLVALRERLLSGLRDRIPEAYLIGHPHRRLPGHLCLGIRGVEAEAVKLMLALDEAGVAASSGSACSSRDVGRPSHVLEAMGLDPIQARGPLRLTLGRFTTPGEVEQLIELVARVVPSLRSTTSRAAH